MYDNRHNGTAGGPGTDTGTTVQPGEYVRKQVQRYSRGTRYDNRRNGAAGRDRTWYENGPNGTARGPGMNTGRMVQSGLMMENRQNVKAGGRGQAQEQTKCYSQMY